jgi:[citrate (pro-3S)-lyase] ligase
LLEEAARNCGVLHVFVLSEGTHDQGDFPPEVRRTLVEQGTAHLPNVIVHPTGPYLISAATFPDYFLRKTSESAGHGAAASVVGAVASVAGGAAAINAELDLVIFAEHFAKPLGIRRRFVGTEPFSPVTAAYNRQMQAVLPRYGIEVREIPRKEHAGRAISATEVRRLIAQGRIEELRPLVPEVTWQYLRGGGACPSPVPL